MDVDPRGLGCHDGRCVVFLCSLTGRRPVCAKYALCGPVMVRFSLGLARSSQKPMVVEIEVSLQVSFFSDGASHCSCHSLNFGATV